MAKNERGKAPTSEPSLQPQLPQQPEEPYTPEFLAHARDVGIDAEEGRMHDAWNAWRAALRQQVLPGAPTALQVKLDGPDAPIATSQLDGITVAQHTELVQATRGLMVALQRTGTQAYRMRLVGEAGDRVQEALKALGHSVSP